jgi:hypothetical protein
MFRRETQEQLDEEIRIMDAAGVESATAFAPVGEGPTYRAEAFDNAYKVYSKYPKPFHIYCGIDLRGVDKPGFGTATIAELERCHKMGAVGVGELHDKGRGSVG